ncbi:DNA polymerase sliding clamp [Stetteria hydrogenophila]
MRFQYPAATKFKYITQALAKINDEALMIVNSDEVTIWLMSPDKVSLAIVKIPSISLESIETEGEVKYKFRTDELNKIAKRATRNDILIIESNHETGGLNVVLQDKKTGVTRTFDLTSMEEPSEEYREPKFEATTRFSMSASDFKAIARDAKVVGDIVVFKSQEGELHVSCSGEGKEYLWIMKPGAPLLDLEVDEPSESSYARQVLDAASKPAGAAEDVRVAYASQYPMKIEYTFPNGEKMYIYIAPSFE